MRGALDIANIVLVGYPLAVLVGLQFWPGITLSFVCVGAAVAVPLLLWLGRSGEAEDDRPPGHHGVAWFRFFLAGVAFSWLFIFATLVGWWQDQRRTVSSFPDEGPSRDDWR